MKEDARESIPSQEILRHSSGLRAFVRALLPGEDAVDDVLQDTWRVALERPPRERGSFGAWLRGVARNRVREHRRSERRRIDRELRSVDGDHSRRSPESASDAENPLESAERIEVLRALLDSLDSLDEPYRRTLLLRYFDDLPSAEIARRDGVPEATVRARVRRGLARMRHRMDRHHDGDRRAWMVAIAPAGSLAWSVAKGATATASAGGGAAAATAGASASTTTTLAGGVLMATGWKISGVALVVAIAGWVLVSSARDDRPESATDSSKAERVVSIPSLPAAESVVPERDAAPVEDPSISVKSAPPRMARAITLSFQRGVPMA